MVRIRFPPPASQQQTVPALGFDGATDSPKSLSQEPDRWFESRSLQRRVCSKPVCAHAPAPVRFAGAPITAEMPEDEFSFHSFQRESQ